MANIMTVRPPDELRNRLKNAAKNRGYTLNQLVLQILWAWAEEHENKTA